ncbi:hypothetical protein CFter6_1646 [Collimonas fungivorans]|uniref:Uncharacterized protein n=1 Tax=Collimonas fungivorans TaxID=158899 RepID=A0A127P9B9_9BURK|nr:hypothetical protein CFter6_1646 [Collimonas fungivorans]
MKMKALWYTFKLFAQFVIFVQIVCTNCWRKSLASISIT